MSPKILLLLIFVVLLAVSFKAVDVVLSKEAKQENRLLLKDRIKGAIIGIIFWSAFVYYATIILYI